MLPLILALAGGGLVVHRAYKKHHEQSHPLAPLVPHPTLIPAVKPGAPHALGLPPGRPPMPGMRPPMPRPPTPPIHLPPGVRPPSVPKGVVTPARAAIHGELMQNCIDPNKLVKAAHLFGAEGLPFHAEALHNKAQTLHHMIHAAQSIVERCRAGDQHAMAIAKGIGDQARAGNKRAQVSAWLIQEYSKAKPATAKAAA